MSAPRPAEAGRPPRGSSKVAEPHLLESLGVIGVGNMGLAMALRLRECGFKVMVRDIDPAREALAVGCNVATSPAQMAGACDLIIIAVVDAAQTREVLFGDDGVVAGEACARCIVLCPTISPGDTEHFAALLAHHGLQTIDAPMSGGPLRARSGTMSLMLACADEVLEHWRHVLAALSNRQFRISEHPGDGARTKLVNNLLAAINLAGAAEAMALAGKLGLDPATTLGVIEQSSGQSWIGSDRLHRALRGEAEAQAHLGLLAKDSRLAMAEAVAIGLPLAVGAAAAQCFAQALADGLGHADDSMLWPWLAAETAKQR